MNSKGGCCIGRYGGGGAGGGSGMYGMTEVERIMLKFRPIAPKPVAAGSGSTKVNSDGYVRCVRSKRKYVSRVNKNKKKDNSKRCSGDEKVKAKTSSSPPVVTLSLLPETPDRKECLPATDFSDLLLPVRTNNNNNNNNKKSAPAPTPEPLWLSFDNQKQKAQPLPPSPEVVSYVMVECVTDTWVDLEGLGCTDEERMMKMEKDTCPGFISDGQDRVVWTNKAYRQMVGVEDMAVVLVQKDIWRQSPVIRYPAFTCKARVSSTFHSHRQTCPTLMLPCDVWRMECGACAWRLDVKAALSLGR